MATYKNDTNHIIPRNEFADIIYENFLFDIPKLLDFCSVYADTNRSQVEKAVNGIFEAQPKYLLDLKSVADFFPTILDLVCEGFDLTDDRDMPRKISPSKGHQSKKAKPKDAKMLELISFTYDTFNSLRVLFEVHQPTAEPFFSILTRVTEFYEAFCDHLCEDLSKLKDLPEELSNAFCLTRYSMLQVFRQVFYQSTLKRIFEVDENREEIVECYLSTLQMALNNGKFIADYFHYFPIQEDVELIEQIGVEFDEMRLNLIRDSIVQLTQIHSPEQNLMHDDIMTGNNLANGDNFSDGESCLGAAAGGADWSSLSDEELQKISSIMELLPHLEMGFIKRCLDFYKGDAETVISVILEDNLPPSLRNDDQGSEFESGDPECVAGPSQETKESSVLSKRRNIYDGDEFDVFSHDINVSRVHIGKKSQELKISGLDKSIKQKVKQYSRLGDEDDALYQDEYDDTYDDHVLGEVDVDDIDELLERDASVAKPMNRPFKREESEEEEDEVGDSQPVKNPMLFHEDPALLRERAAQNQAFKNASRANPQRRNRRNKSDSDDDDMNFPRNNNNAPRGRARFNHANHNRRDLAARKHRF